MTKVEIIKEVIGKKEIELKAAKTAYTTFQQEEAQPGYKEIVDNYFNDFQSEDIYTKVSNDGETITFMRPQDGYNYDKDIMELRFSTDYETGDLDDIRTSVYSTSDNSTWELERLQLVGHVASILIDHKDDLIAEVQSFKDEISVDKKALWKAAYRIESDITSLNDEINDIMLTFAKERLESSEGMLFDKEKLGNIDIAYNCTVSKVMKARIVRKTASGKSVDIELTLKQYDDSEYVNTYKAVRMSNVHDLLWQYRDYVIKAQA